MALPNLRGRHFKNLLRHMIQLCWAFVTCYPFFFFVDVSSDAAANSRYSFVALSRSASVISVLISGNGSSIVPKFLFKYFTISSLSSSTLIRLFCPYLFVCHSLNLSVV